MQSRTSCSVLFCRATSSIIPGYSAADQSFIESRGSAHGAGVEIEQLQQSGCAQGRGVVVAADDLDALANCDTMRPMPALAGSHGAVDGQDDVAGSARSVGNRQVQSGEPKHFATEHFGQRFQFRVLGNDSRRLEDESPA